ncbi:hypothetical protein C8F01DRAFT_1254779 [Mycena amicta]|nr:hypothetical protein C8F01DRAFT_1254779 [Mycena amicta]
MLYLMCSYAYETEACACGLDRYTGRAQKVDDCRDKACQWSLFHPLSMYRNGCGIVPSEKGGFQLLRATFSNGEATFAEPSLASSKRLLLRTHHACRKLMTFDGHSTWDEGRRRRPRDS